MHPGRFSELRHEVWGFLGVLVVGALVTIVSWPGVFSWSHFQFDGSARRLRYVDGVWPWLKRVEEPFRAFRAVVMVTNDTGHDSSSQLSYSVTLFRVEPSDSRLVVEICSDLDEAWELTDVVSRMMHVERVWEEG